MPTLQSTDTPSTDQFDAESQAQLDAKKRAKDFRKRIDACKVYRRKLVQLWQVSVDYRRGKPFASATDEDRIAVPLDWTLTEMKQALLFSQVPTVRVDHAPDTQNLPWAHSFEQRINDTLRGAGIDTVMDEVLPDCINAAGIGVVMVSYEAITEDVEVPSIDLSMFPPSIMQQILQTGMLPNGQPIPMESVPRVLDKRYVIERVSPGNFLWPISFTGSNFDKSSWLGRSGAITWAEAQQRWNLDPSQKQSYIGSPILPQDRIATDNERDLETSGDEFVDFDEIFYREQPYDPASTSYNAIHHMVFIKGKDEPVVDEPWKGQQIDPQTGQVIGAQHFPIRVLTLAYITDDAIPPSDSAIGRAQVDEINKARTQMIQQRQYSIPIRTFDVNRVDPMIQFNLMRGKWQGMIPVQGVGTNVISEVTKSSFPQENFKFDSIAKGDLFSVWMVGQDASGSEVETAGEASAITQNTNVRISRARAKVGKFFCSIAEALGGLICLYEDPASFGQGFDPSFSKALSYSILADSTLLVDANQRLKRLMDFINFTAKSGRVDIEPVLKEIATLSGLDPNVVIIKPQPKPPVEPNISLRLTGTEDLLNPLVLAFLINSGQAPSMQLIEQAKQIIAAAVNPPMPPQQPGMPPAGAITGAPDTLGPSTPLPLPAPPAVGAAHPNWSAMNRVNQRVLDRGGEQP